MNCVDATFIHLKTLPRNLLVIEGKLMVLGDENKRVKAGAKAMREKDQKHIKCIC
jgi:hypothetical protein